MKTIQVKEVHRLYGQTSVTVSEDVTLSHVITLLGREPHLKGVFMLDVNQRYIGIISRFDLLKWTQFQLYGAKKIKKIPVKEFLDMVKATKTKDLVINDSVSFSLKEDDTLQTALDLMIGYEEDIIPVLDSEGKIIGDVSLSELLSKALEVGI